jgi:hypothetical protein
MAAEIVSNSFQNESVGESPDATIGNTMRA